MRSQKPRPVHGRARADVLLASCAEHGIRVSYHYGIAADMGGGPSARPEIYPLDKVSGSVMTLASKARVMEWRVAFDQGED